MLLLEFLDDTGTSMPGIVVTASFSLSATGPRMALYATTAVFPLDPASCHNWGIRTLHHHATM